MNFQLNEDQRDDINIYAGKISSIGQLMSFLEDGDLMAHNLIGIFKQLGMVLESSADGIREITDKIEMVAMEKEAEARRLKEKEHLADPKTIASFKHSIEKLLESLEPETRQQMVSELAEWADSHSTADATA